MDASTQPMIDQIESMVQDVPGWSPIDELHSLFLLAWSSAHLGGDLVEVGSWCGRSSVVLGHAARLTGRTVVHCVDLFPSKSDWHENSDGTFSFSVRIGEGTVGAYAQQTVWREPYEKAIVPVYERHDSVLQRFQEAVERHGLQTIVRAHRGTSASFLRTVPLDFRCRLAFVDADHSYEAVAGDIQRLTDVLLPGGWLCFDDAFSSYEGVDRAIRECVIGHPAYDLGQQLTRKFFSARRTAWRR